MKIEKYTENDLGFMKEIWNEVVQQGIAFPQEEILDDQSARKFFEAQSYCGVARNNQKEAVGLYLLHPNNVGRCSHICKASYAVRSDQRAREIGKALVLDCLKQAKRLGFRILQFNAVVEDNHAARKLYENLGFKQLGTIPGGFHNIHDEYANICPYYIEL